MVNKKAANNLSTAARRKFQFPWKPVRFQCQVSSVNDTNPDNNCAGTQRVETWFVPSAQQTGLAFDIYPWKIFASTTGKGLGSPNLVGSKTVSPASEANAQDPAHLKLSVCGNTNILPKTTRERKNVEAVARRKVSHLCLWCGEFRSTSADEAGAHSVSSK